jgi:hypothetical protein
LGLGIRRNTLGNQKKKNHPCNQTIIKDRKGV